MAGVCWCCVLALGVMPAWCGPEQILFIFNQISARIRTEREPGHERGGGGICEVTRGPGVTGRGRQEQEARQLPSYTSVPRQFTSFSHQTGQASRTRRESGPGRRQNAYKESRTREQGRHTGEHRPMRAQCWAAGDQ